MSFEKNKNGGTGRTPEERLSSRTWRLLNSWWIVLPLVSFGLLSWVGFFIAGVQLRRPKYWISTAVYLVLMVAGLWVSDRTDSVGETVFTVSLLVCFIGAFLQSIVMNRRYLIELAHRRSWYQAQWPGPAPARDGGQQGQFHGVPHGPYGPAQGTYPAGPPQGGLSQVDGRSWPMSPSGASGYVPPQPVGMASNTGSFVGVPPATLTGAVGPRTVEGPIGVDVNSASALELAAVQAVGPELAERIVGTRQVRGPFRDLDDLAFTLGLQPHELIRIRDHLVVRVPTAPPEGSRGRLLDF